MRIVALLAVRNEELYMERCLRHLWEQGIETYVIDNDSNDRTREIAESFRNRGVIHIEVMAYPGFYDWCALLKRKQDLAREIQADWFIHHDADEIREPPEPYKTLAEGVTAVDQAGFNAINFDEFVFVPPDSTIEFEGKDYVAEMDRYYFFEPKPLHRVNAWKRLGISIDLVSSGGHSVSFEGRHIYDRPFILRHYIILSRAHGLRKYGSTRIYSENEVTERGWHGWRAKFDKKKFRLPPTAELHISELGHPLKKDRPFRAHKFILE